MDVKTVSFEGKIKVSQVPGAKTLLDLLKYLSEDLGFSVKRFKSDEVKLAKNEFINEQVGHIEVTKSNVAVEIEIEVSDNGLEVEIESESLELVGDLTEKISSRL